MNSVRHNPFVRKGLAQLQRARGATVRWMASDRDYESRPPVMCNSFPKSGTHLLLQIVKALPGSMHLGRFVASVPPVQFRLRQSKSLCQRISKVAPGECLGAHLYWDEALAHALQQRRVVHFFIYRDPRDVVVSEMHYLTEKAWWHRMHRHFRDRTDEEARLLLSIDGMESRYPVEYPDIAKRFGFYEPWLHDENVCAIRFEDLIGPQRPNTVRQIVDHYVDRCLVQHSHDAAAIAARAVAAIAPERSHTFRQGQSGDWAEVFSPQLKTRFKEVTSDLLMRLGYESDSDW